MGSPLVGGINAPASPQMSCDLARKTSGLERISFKSPRGSFGDSSVYRRFQRAQEGHLVPTALLCHASVHQVRPLLC